jgi:hypothetical protein
MAIAAALIIAAGAFYFWPQDGGPPKADQEQVIARLSSQVAPIMAVGLKQHLHCGVFREYPVTAPTPADLARDKQVSAALIDAVESHAPEGIHVVMAHRCSYQGRDYIHVVARGQGHLMSLLIVRRGDGDGVGPDATASARSGPDIYAVNALETPGYMVYVVSDESPAENRKALEAMGPQVEAALL